MDKRRAQLEELGRKRKSVLAAAMKGLLRYPAAFEVEPTNHFDGTPQVVLNNAGQARDLGFEFKELRRFRLVLQETLRVPDGRPPFYVIRYSYIFVDADTGERLFRFEYHPDLEKRDNRWSLIHHFHIGDDEPPPEEDNESAEPNEAAAKPPLYKLHFPLWPFLEEPDDKPHEVLPRVLAWSREELKRIDARRSVK